jgi:orotidine-5'-phosphate decarboxylase
MSASSKFLPRTSNAYI